MHEILFRGFHPDENGKEKVFIDGKEIKGFWIESNSIMQTNYSGTFLYFEGMWREVISDTVGQYTGLKDKNGKRIFLGDIAKILYTDWVSQPIGDTRPLEEYLDGLTEKGVVTFAPYVGWYLNDGINDKSIICGTHGYLEKIGNIHSNPELLEVRE
mgnify:CR=1 FL=1